MTSSTQQPNLSPADIITNSEPYNLRHTNVSNPSIIRNQPSQQSITASEDYYSLSASSSSGRSQDTVVRNGSVGNTINRYTTPPSRYRTPAQSQGHLPIQSRDNLGTTLGTQYDVPEEEVRKTPMRGQGKRRSTGSSDEAGPSAPAAAVLREGGIRRKPVPSTVMENPDSPRSQEYIDQSRSRSSVARDFDSQASPPTPGQDDTPYIRFALDQLTRDEEVRGSRAYPGQATAPGVAGPAGVAYAVQPGSTEHRDLQPAGSVPVSRYAQPDQTRDAQQPGPSTYPTVGNAYREEAYPSPSRLPDQPPPRNPHRTSDNPLAPGFDIEKQVPLSQYAQNKQQRMPDQRPDPFVYVPNDGGLHAPLKFLPGILRPLALGLFILLLLVLTILLTVSAILSYVRSGLADYTGFGNAVYFVFEYLPTLLGVILFFWVVQIQVAVYRIAPFIAISSENPHTREEGARSPIYPKSFLLPYIGHFKAKQAIVGIFMLVAWLQIWTLPLLASSFNVYFYDAPQQWRWIATTGAIWVVIALYGLLLTTSIALLIWLRKQESGLRWDPRSLADIIVLLERSNALSMSEDEELRHEAPRLGYWRTQRGHNDIFQSYGVADKTARQYGLGEDGRIHEKAPLPPAEPKSRYSDPELEMAREQRHSREKMLPRHTNSDDFESGSAGGRAIPWFLRPSAALLWAVAAFVLLLAFLIVSYLPSTAISNGFTPAVPAPIGNLGFSSTNFLYSFVPALIATVCFLGWLDMDYAHRRLQPLASLVPATPMNTSRSSYNEHSGEGELAETSLLLSYAADFPILVTGAALVNKHFRVAGFSFLSLIAAMLPVLGGGVFWALYYTPSQSVRVTAHMPAYYALTVFVALYALGCIAIAIPSKRMREIDAYLPHGNRGTRFTDILAMVRGSKMLDDVAFHGPISKIDLVTRLLSAEPGYGRPENNEKSGLLYPSRNVLGANEAAGASKVSVADSVRGFGHARQNADGFGGVGVPRYSLGRFEGRDGRDAVGIDRVRR